MSDERRLLSTEAADLLKAAEYIEKHGWCQGEHTKPDGSVCIYGALDVVAGEIGANAAGDIFRNYTGVHVASWNDSPGRTKEEVVKTLRAAAWFTSTEPRG